MHRFPGGSDGEDCACHAGDLGSTPEVGRSPGEGKGYPLQHSWACQVALVGKNPPANAGDAGDTGLIPGSGRSPGEGNSNPFQHSCLENPMDRRAWWGPWGRKESDTTEGPSTD